ncbi:SH3 domain-containing protein [Chamaesiphon sp. VAR_48_metabat_135_sub]|uniref:SH3 domain-containing protein n=1 Tax=Chamaesiphon sp. VAR_48_metabat_135_sub TaxID=2964699 RepID=UPI00286D3BCA|nr:SH3 domain-containing protein [Chamaesiphon sp. VAR_48_metabat_135_sub]
MKLKAIETTIVLAMFISLLPNTASVSAQNGPGGYGRVNTVYSCSRDGDTINLRSRAGQQYRVLNKIPSGKPVVLIGEAKVVGEFTWQKVRFYGAVGWVRGDFLCN